jgi:hypothetical protein
MVVTSNRITPSFFFFEGKNNYKNWRGMKIGECAVVIKYLSIFSVIYGVLCYSFVSRTIYQICKYL